MAEANPPEELRLAAEPRVINNVFHIGAINNEYHHHHGDIIHNHVSPPARGIATQLESQTSGGGTETMDRYQLNEMADKGHEALLHENEEASKFISIYRKEVVAIPEENKDDWANVLSVVSKTWETLYNEIMIDIRDKNMEGGDRVRNALASICKHLKRQSLEELVIEDDFLRQFVGKVKDVMNMGSILAEKQLNIISIICFYVAAKLHHISTKRNFSVLGIKETVEKITSIIKKITKEDNMMKKVIHCCVLPLLLEMSELVPCVADAEPKVKFINEVWCLYNVALCYYYCDIREKSVTVNLSVIQLMEKEYNNDAVKRRVFGHCHHNAALAYSENNQFGEAIEHYRVAVESYEKATDWASENHRNEKVKLTKEYLRRAEVRNN
ncbi:uncharacterized protein LOC144411668 [Styela clava]